MPTYSAKCKNCGKSVTYRRSIAERNQTPVCCELPMQRQLDAPFAKVDFPAAGRR